MTDAAAATVLDTLAAMLDSPPPHRERELMVVRGPPPLRSTLLRARSMSPPLGSTSPPLCSRIP
jgi:hypothetical protein